MYLFLTFSLFLGCKIHLHFFKLPQIPKSFFNIFIEKKSAYKGTYAIQTCVVQELTILTL